MLNKLVSIVFILLAGICSAQKPMIQLIVDPKVSQVGEEITVKVISNIDDKQVEAKITEMTDKKKSLTTQDLANIIIKLRFVI